ncbi:MAG: nucleoside deaminase [Acidobacteriota bacterium]
MNQMFMREAIRISIEKMRRNEGGPFGAVVVRGGRVVGRGWNRVTSSCDPTAHAEVVAIRDACRRLKRFQLADCDLYTSCEPCPMCLGSVYWARIRCVYYGNTRRDAARIGFDDSLIYHEISRPLSKRKIPMKRLLHEEALVAFDEWERKPDKVPY